MPLRGNNSCLARRLRCEIEITADNRKFKKRIVTILILYFYITGEVINSGLKVKSEK